VNGAIRLGPVFWALVAFAALFNPWTVHRLPERGWAAALLSPQTFFLLASLVLLRTERASAAAIGLGRERLGRNLLWGLGLGASTGLLTMAAAGVLTLLDREFGFLPRPLFGGEPLGIRFDGWRLFLLVVLAPVSEEIFFRGFLLRALREVYPAWAAVAISALIFMAGHGGLRPGPLLLGLITAPAALATGSLLPGVLFHAISNAYGPILVLGFPNLYRYLAFLFQ
jgi:membrane protease YdiL (CAAX protease family)